jgi:hypothetical protein
MDDHMPKGRSGIISSFEQVKPGNDNPLTTNEDLKNRCDKVEQQNAY